MRQIIRADRRLAVAAGDIEHVIRLAQAGDASPQSSHQLLALRDRRAQMRRARRKIAMMQVIGLDAAFDEGPHQRFQDFGIVIDATQQHRLAHQGNAGVRQPRAGGAGLGRQFARMVGMNGDPGRRALRAQRPNHVAVDARRRGHRHAGVDADDLDVIDRRQLRHDLGQPPRRQHQGIAAGQDDFPDFLRAHGYSRARRDRRRPTAPSPCPARPFRGGSRTGNTPRRHAPA